MDAEACLCNIQSAIDDKDWSDAVSGLANYWRWRSMQGAQPLHGDARAQMLACTIADALEVL